VGEFFKRKLENSKIHSIFVERGFIMAKETTVTKKFVGETVEIPQRKEGKFFNKEEDLYPSSIFSSSSKGSSKIYTSISRGKSVSRKGIGGDHRK